jgi:DNA-binding response OmpR family regulator
MKKKVLIIEDNLETAEVLKVILNSLDLDVMLAADGIIGGRLAVSGKPDLIILDIMLPEKSGLELLKELKEQPETSRIPVMMASVMANPESLAKAKELGAADYTTKPFDIQKLKDKVNGLLGS